MATIVVRVQPRSTRRAVIESRDGVWRIALTSPPEGGKANRELLKFLAKCLGVAPSRLTLASGGKAREKRIVLEGLSEIEVEERLAGCVRQGE